VADCEAVKVRKVFSGAGPEAEDGKGVAACVMLRLLLSEVVDAVVLLEKWEQEKGLEW